MNFCDIVLFKQYYVNDFVDTIKLCFTIYVHVWFFVNELRYILIKLRVSKTELHYDVCGWNV